MLLLFVDDEQDNIILGKAFFKSKYPNITLLEATDGEEALKLCQEHNDIDLVLMDLKMPKMDGFIATKKIKEIKSWIKIIAFTCYEYCEIIEQYKDAGFDGYISKPLNQLKIQGLLTA